ncbi:MAG: ribulokinase [Bacteroidetes bacterium]|nr:MAG: ribulokinase [Bacteroidota bacterium]
MKDDLVIGMDYGTDSVRAVLTQASNGRMLATDVFYYPRWAKGLYCDAAHNCFRQHPLDYLEGLEATINKVLEGLSPARRQAVRGIAVDTTGSTPIAVDRSGTPLAFQQAFAHNPNAMFVLWKDHTAIAEAEAINRHNAAWPTDYLRYVGGIYSSEWFWAKILHILRTDEAVREAAYSWVEHCDWIPHVLTGGQDIHQLRRSRCAAGHKALWHEDFGGLPPDAYWTALDPLLSGLRQRLYRHTYTADVAAGTLCEEWAQRLGLSQEVVVSVGAFDAHIGAVGGEIKPYYLSRIMGTSTCDILVAPNEEMGDRLVKGICGQVDGSVVPGMLGMEAGQSAFGDVYAWFREVLAWPLKELAGSGLVTESQVESWVEQLIPALSEAAARLPLKAGSELALDWHNGRRTPDANQALKGALFNLNLGSDAPRLFKALVEATCFGSKAIVDRFAREGVPIKGIVALGGVAQKSPYVMQTLANVLEMPIQVAAAIQSCALGAAMFAATAAGLYPDVWSAQQAMGAGFQATYHPQPESSNYYRSQYELYLKAGACVEKLSR